MGTSRQYFFAEFRLDGGQRALFRKDELVSLTPKALETLLFLVERHGRIVDKKELMDAVWPETFVEEVSLARNVSILRRVLSENEDGQSFIETIPKRGYRFVAPVREDPVATVASPSSELPTTAGQPVSSKLPADPIAPAPSRTRFVGSFWLLACAAAVICVAALTYWLVYSRPALSFAQRDWVLIADIENRTGDPRFDKALLTALTVSIEQSRYANVSPRSRIYETLKRMGRPQDPARDLTINEALGREICLRENLRALVVTSITRTGKEYLLIGRLVDPKSGVAVRSYTKKVQKEDGILDALDTLAGNFRHDLGESLYSIRKDDRPLAVVTTASLTALQHYSEANALWERGKYPEAQAQLLEAVRIDPDFAMARAALGNQFHSYVFNDPKRGNEEYEQAVKLSNRITDRERMFIEASFADTQGHAEEAERLYHALLESYPDDAAARFNLAGLYLGRSRCDEAIAQYQELIRIDPSDVNSRINIATCYANQGKYASALPYYARVLELEPSRVFGNLSHEYGFILVGAGQPDKAREFFASNLEVPAERARAIRSLGMLDLYEGRYKEAAEQFAEAIGVNESQHDALAAVRNRSYLATVLGGWGDRAGELRALDQATQASDQLQRIDWLAYRIGVTYARAGAVDKAARILQRAKTAGSVDTEASRSDADRLQGEILLARGDTLRAVQVLEQAHRENHPPLSILTLDSVARAYEKAGQLEQAISSYESLLSFQGGNPLGWEAQYPWLEAHYALAKIHAARGNATRPIELLDQLLGIWKNADADLPLLQQAKALRESLNR